METSNETLPLEKENSSSSNDIEGNNDSSNKRKFPNNSNPKMCIYFSNYNYCKFGNSCKYEHFKREARNVKSNVSHSMRKHMQVEKKNELQMCNKQTSSTQSCRYFKMGACKKGESCEFFHSTNLDNEMSALSISSQSQKSAKKLFSTSKSLRKRTSTPLCHYFKKGLCLKGDNCKFYHQNKNNLSSSECSNFNAERCADKSSLPNKNILCVSENFAAEKTVPVINRVLNVYDVSSLNSDLIRQLRSTEINQLKKRFPQAEVITDNHTFSILFQPSDPDWGFDLNKLKLEVDFPVNYPVDECRITVVQGAENIPYLLIKHLNGAIFDWIRGKFEENSKCNKTELIFRTFLKWFDKNIEDLFITGLKKVRQDLKAKADGIEFVAVENLFSSPKRNNAENCSELEASSVTSALTSADTSLEATSELQVQTSTANNKTSSEVNRSTKSLYYSSNNATKIIFTDLEFIEGTAAFTCTSISATLQCSRCKTSFNMKSVPKKVHSRICTKCSKNVSFTFEPATVHQFSSVLGNLHLLDCAVVDINLIDCHFLIDCLNCSKQVPVDGIHYGQKYKMWCLFCNQKMLISVGSAKFQILKLASDPVVKHSSAKKIERKSKDPVIKQDEPLPNFGACKHYKKSFRWLRFPCCGRLYPCDECHNEKETDHEMKYASRMVCGFCAKEQPYSKEKPCLSCSQSLAKKSGSHWEGGKGCRNRIQMSREDKQKYSGVSKTVSKKAQSAKPKKKH